jgi:hypothetical protein
MRLPVVTSQIGGRVGLSSGGSTFRYEGPRPAEGSTGKSQLHDNAGRLMVSDPLTGDEMDELGW